MSLFAASVGAMLFQRPLNVPMLLFPIASVKASFDLVSDWKSLSEDSRAWSSAIAIPFTGLCSSLAISIASRSLVIAS